MLLMAVSTGLWLIFASLRREIDVIRMYDNFIAHVTHELKSPLASIQLHLETMKTRSVPRDVQGEFLDLMLLDARRLDSRINAILEIARREEQNVPYQLQEVDLDDFVEEAIQEARVQFRLPAGSISVHGSASCVCLVDLNALGVVIDNLIDNAVKYSADQPRIEVSLVSDKNWARVSVTDYGIGIPLHVQSQVFRKYWRFEDPESPNVTGTGLGLYWVREIVRHHGGRVTVVSKGRNRGTTFTVVLPVQQILEEPSREFTTAAEKKVETDG